MMQEQLVLPIATKKRSALESPCLSNKLLRMQEKGDDDQNTDSEDTTPLHSNPRLLIDTNLSHLVNKMQALLDDDWQGTAWTDTHLHHDIIRIISTMPDHLAALGDIQPAVGKSLFHIACHVNGPLAKHALSLLQHLPRTSVAGRILNVRDADGRTALDIACKQGNYNICKDLVMDYYDQLCYDGLHPNDLLFVDGLMRNHRLV